MVFADDSRGDVLTAKLIAISLGAVCGALLRYGVACSAIKLFGNSFPWGTLVANVVGCLLMGLVLGGAGNQQTEVVRLGFGVGFLGSLTTFSTFGGETVGYLLDGKWGIATANVFANVLVCLAAVMLGVIIARRIWN